MTEDKNDNNYAPNFPWDDMSDNISGLKRLRGDEDDYDDDVKPFSGMNPMENQVCFYYLYMYGCDYCHVCVAF